MNLQTHHNDDLDLDLGFDLTSFDLDDGTSEEPSSVLSPHTTASSRTDYFDDDEVPCNEEVQLDISSSNAGAGGGFDMAFDDFHDDADMQAFPGKANEILIGDGMGLFTVADGMDILESGELVMHDASAHFNLNRDPATTENEVAISVDDLDFGPAYGEGENTATVSKSGRHCKSLLTMDRLSVMRVISMKQMPTHLSLPIWSQNL